MLVGSTCKQDLIIERRPAPLSEVALRFGVPPMPNLAWTPEVERETAHLYEKVKKIVPPVEWPFYAPYVKAINDLKKQRSAVILAHNYQTPEIYNCVADFVGDSLQLARVAAKPTPNDRAGRRYFMAETSKSLNPEKIVLIPDPPRRLFARRLDHRRRCARCCERNIPACLSSPISTPRPK